MPQQNSEVDGQRWKMSAETGAGKSVLGGGWLRIAPPEGGYGLSVAAQLHRYASIRNIQGGCGSGWTEAGELQQETKRRFPAVLAIDDLRP